jgi:uncharacterized protein DUF3618
MAKDQSQVSTSLNEGQKEPEELRREIERTRAELGETVEALVAKTDVKARAREKVAEAKVSAAHRKDEVIGKARDLTPDSAGSASAGAATKAREHPLPVAVAGGFAAGFLVARLTGRH